MSQSSVASSGVRPVLNADLQETLRDLKTSLGVMMNIYYDVNQRREQARAVDDMIYILGQYRQGAMLDTSHYINNSNKVRRYPQEIHQRSRDLTTIQDLINEARRDLESFQISQEIIALETAIRNLQNSDNKAEFDRIMMEINEKMARIRDSETIDHRDKIIMLSNISKLTTQLEGHGSDRSSMGVAIPAVVAAQEAAHGTVASINGMFTNYVGIGMNALSSVAFGSARLFLGATRVAGISSRQAVGAVINNPLTNGLRAYSAAALQTTALAISNMLADQERSPVERNNLRLKLNNFDPALADLISGMGNLPEDPQLNDNVNLIIAEQAFAFGGSRGSSINSSNIPSLIQSLRSTPAASQQSDAIEWQPMGMPDLTERDIQSINQAISRSVSIRTSGSDSSNITRASIQEAGRELGELVRNIQSIQARLIEDHPIDRSPPSELFIDVLTEGPLTLQFGDSGVIENAAEVKDDFNSAVGQTDVLLDQAAVALMPYAQEQYMENRHGKKSSREEGEDEEDEEGESYNSRPMQRVKRNTPPDEFGGAIKIKNRYHKKSKASKKRKGQNKKGGRKTKKGKKHYKTLKRYRNKTQK